SSFGMEPRPKSPCRSYSAPAAHGSFPTLSLKIFPWMLDPVPPRSHRVRLPVSSPVASAFPQRRWGRLPASIRESRLLAGPCFRGLQIFLNVPASKFAHPPDRPYRCAYCHRAAGAFTSGHIVLRYLHAPDMLTVRRQAIDGTGTCTLLDSQPCRLLTSLHGHYSASPLLRTPPPPSRRSPISRLRRLYGSLLRRFRGGARRASPVARCIPVIGLSLHPRQSVP